jgi:hypothetical protein
MPVWPTTNEVELPSSVMTSCRAGPVPSQATCPANVEGKSTVLKSSSMLRRRAQLLPAAASISYSAWARSEPRRGLLSE